MFQKLDNFLFDYIFEKFSHWFQKITSKTCFWLAKIFFIIAEIFEILRVFGFLYLGFNVSFFEIFIIIIIPLFIFICEKEEKLFLKDTLKKEKYINKRRLSGAFSRPLSFVVVVLLFWLPLMIPGFWFYLDILDVLILIIVSTLLFGLYFLDCTPLPPGTSKMKQWKDKILTKIYEALEPKGESIPIKS